MRDSATLELGPYHVRRCSDSYSFDVLFRRDFRRIDERLPVKKTGLRLPRAEDVLPKAVTNATHFSTRVSFVASMEGCEEEDGLVKELIVRCGKETHTVDRKEALMLTNLFPGESYECTYTVPRHKVSFAFRALNEITRYHCLCSRIKATGSHLGSALSACPKSNL